MVEISTPQDVVSVVGQELNVVVVGQEVIETPVYENPLKGKDGRDGVDGKDGRDGIDGVNGRDGIDGRDGRDGRDGKDGLNGINSWIENIDDTLYFRNDGGLPEPKPVKLKEQIKAWGFGARRGGGQLPADWNQKDKNNPTFIKNKPDLSEYATEKWVEEQGYLKDLSSEDITNALGYTPYSNENPNNYQTETEVVTKVSNHNISTTSHSDIRQSILNLDSRIDDIELFKFPNAIIIGDPTIQNGQVSDFSTVSYLQFPFVFDFENRAFQVDFCFTTTQNVQTQQNILDSRFGIAIAIQNGKGVMAISSNGTSWDVGVIVGNINIQSNTTYYGRLVWNKLQYKTYLSTDGVNYTQDMVVTAAVRPYPTTVFIGGCSLDDTGHTPHPFLGTINLNKAYLYVNSQLIWQGMDDAGLATRADVSLDNLDAAGQAKFDAKQDVLPSGNVGQFLIKTSTGVEWADLPVYDGSSR